MPLTPAVRGPAVSYRDQRYQGVSVPPLGGGTPRRAATVGARCPASAGGGASGNQFGPIVTMFVNDRLSMVVTEEVGYAIMRMCFLQDSAT